MQEVRSGLSSGDVERAVRVAERVLALPPGHPQALNLVADLACQAGRREQAEFLLRQSLACQVAQPQVWRRLGQIVHELGRLPEALMCLDASTRLDPADPQARYDQALLLHEAGELEAAGIAIQEALKAAVDRPARLLQLHALVAADLGRHAEALGILDEALKRYPAEAALHHNRGVVLRQLLRPAQARQAFERALHCGLRSADLHYNLANVLQEAGDLQAAVDHYRQALDLDGRHALTLRDLPRLLWRLGDHRADATLERAAQAAPDDPEVLGQWAEFCLRAQRSGRAAALYRHAARHQPQRAAWANGLGLALAQDGRTEEALPWLRRAVELDAQCAAFRCGLAAAQLEAGQIEAAAAQLDEALRIAPEDQYAWALRALQWRCSADIRSRWLEDVDRLVAVLDLPPPAGHADIGEFNTSLSRCLMRLHADVQAPLDQSLRGGTQTLGNLFDRCEPEIAALRSIVGDALDRALAALPADASHPFLGRKCRSWRFTDSWSSCLRQEGRHTNHVHTHGWISAVYYVQVPSQAQDPALRAGWLQFGCTDLRLPQASQPLRQVAPRPGRLVIFPSYLWHGTTPNASDSPRLTVAFDALPAGA